MGWLNPNAGWFLLFIPFLLALHLLRRQSLRWTVPSLRLWEQVPQEVRSTWARRHAWPPVLFWLQLGALLLGIGGLAQPYRLTADREATHLVLILDGSASMQCRDVLPSRWEAARRAAEAYLEEYDRSVRVALLWAGPRPELILPFTTDRNRVREALSHRTPSDARADLVEALERARSSAVGAVLRIGLFTDQPPPSLPENTDLFLFRGRPENVGITSLLLDRGTASGSEVVASVRLHSDFPRPVEGRVRLLVEGVPVAEVPFRLEADSEATLQLGAPGVNGVDTAFTAELVGIEDDFPPDDVFEAVLPAQRRLRLQVVSPPNRFLDAFLQTVPNVEAIWTTPERYVPRQDVDAVLIRGTALDPLPPQPFVLFDPTGPIPFAREEPTAAPSGPLALQSNETDPLLLGAEWGALRIRGGRVLQWNVPVRRILWSTGRDLIVSGERMGAPWFLFAFDPFDPAVSNFPLHPSGVVILANLVEELRAALRTVPLESRAGEPIPLRAQGPVRILLPGGNEVRASGVFTATERRGIYRVLDAAGRVREQVAVRPAEGPSPGEGTAPTVSPSQAQSPGRRLMGDWFLVAMMGLLLLEWGVYHRRL
ncbi:MAG: hypothetical protein KatS3mg115_0718 [Candidatus Poribacteria bacterium]|nr:MAG: hypothetical protein KatS3mg115_0718 [Candidatus Poribacteria bacterium]